MRTSSLILGTLVASTAAVALVALPGCPNKSCGTTGQSEVLDFDFDASLDERSYDIHIVADLNSADGAGGAYVAYDQLDVTVEGTGSGESGSGIIVELWYDGEASTQEDSATLEPGKVEEQSLTLNDLAWDCSWGEVCEMVAHVDLSVTGDLAEFEGTLAAQFMMDDDEGCDPDAYRAIDIEITIEEI